MTPTELRDAMQRLGLTEAGLARALRLGKQGARTVRRWKAGKSKIQGPAQVAVKYMLAEHESGGIPMLARLEPDEVWLVEMRPKSDVTYVFTGASLFDALAKAAAMIVTLPSPTATSGAAESGEAG